MKHKFRINRIFSAEEKAIYKQVDIAPGKKYLCIKTCAGFSDQRVKGFHTIFDEGKYYELLRFSETEAWFIANGGIEFFMRSFMEGALFEYFDFEKYQTDIMKVKEWKTKNQEKPAI